MTQTTTEHRELLRHAHGSLLLDLRELRCATEEGNLTTLCTRLTAMRDILIEHFHLEEAGGYLHTVRSRTPHLVQTLDLLCEQHRKLLKDLDDILAHLERPQLAPAAIQNQVRLWVREVHEHEIRENDLIQDAYLVDLGTAD